MVVNEKDRLAAANTAAVPSLPLLFATTAAGGDHMMMLLMLTYERCTITTCTLPPRPGMDSEHYNTTTRTNNSCCFGR